QIDELDGKILSIDVSQFAQSQFNRVKQAARNSGHYTDAQLLRWCLCERTNRLGSHYRTGNYFDEFAPVHCPPEAYDKALYTPELGDWKQHLMSALGQKQTHAVQQGMSALPPKADICSAQAHVRFTPESDIKRA